VCVHLDAGDEPPHRLVMVRGYAVCPDHSLLIDETGSIAGALARLNRALVTKASVGTTLRPRPSG
jgi:hypothetical protein